MTMKDNNNTFSVREYVAPEIAVVELSGENLMTGMSQLEDYNENIIL